MEHRLKKRKVCGGYLHTNAYRTKYQLKKDVAVKTGSSMIKVVFFDLDGTLVDSRCARGRSFLNP